MLRQWLGALIGTFLSVTALYTFAPAVVADYLDAGSAEIAEGYVVDKADCRGLFSLVSHCTITLRNLERNNVEPLLIRQVYLGHPDLEFTHPVALGPGPRLNVSAAIENLKGRALAMVLLALIAAFSLHGCLRMAETRGQ
jgi:hypothetical protein